MAGWPLRKKQGIVPDFLIALPSDGQLAADATDELFELKALHHGSSTYPQDLADTRGGAVNRRAAGLPSQTVAKAKRLDTQLCGTSDGETGPVVRRLQAFGPVRGLVVGHWAECSTHFEALLSATAYVGAQQHWVAMQAAEPADANGTLAWLLRRR